MLTLLSPFIGIIGSLLPNVVRIFEKNQENKHEIELNKLKIEAAEKNIKLETALEEVKADVAEGQSLRDHDKSIAYSGLFATLRASVRPVITYLFFALFVIIKLSAAYAMFSSGAAVPVILAAIWDSETMALFSTIIAFWFGSRTLEKMESRISSRSQATPITPTKK